MNIWSLSNWDSYEINPKFKIDKNVFNRNRVMMKPEGEEGKASLKKNNYPI